jgi:uncharacterized protein
MSETADAMQGDSLAGSPPPQSLIPNFSLLDPLRPFNAQFWAFALPYALYVGGNALQPLLGRAQAASLGGLAALAALAFFWRKGAYRLGPGLSFGAAAWAVGLGLLATAIWVGLYRFGFNVMHGIKQAADPDVAYSVGYLVSRGLASTLVIPIAEELLFRVYLLEVLRAKFSKPTPSLEAVVNAPPPRLDRVPVQGLGLWVTALIFSLGHPMAAWPAALAWFALTSLLYLKTQNLWSVILAHALANGLIAYCVFDLNWTWLW